MLRIPEDLHDISVIDDDETRRLLEVAGDPALVDAFAELIRERGALLRSKVTGRLIMYLSSPVMDDMPEPGLYFAFTEEGMQRIF
jgi:hypothetical protein